MFTAGLLTILLPCILPLVPIVLGVSIAGRSKWRPLLTIVGMLVSFVGFTFLLTVVLNQFITLADYIRIATFYVLLLFGLGFFTHNRTTQLVGAILGGVFFWKFGWVSVGISAIVGAFFMHVGGKVATRIQQFGTSIQQKSRQELGEDAPITAFLIGLTMGLVWVPCAGPALGFALTLVREQPGVQAALLLLTYGLGTAIPLLLIGYGGQAATHSVRFLSRYSGRIKQISGVILIITALALQYGWLRDIEIYLVSNTSFGNLGVDLEKKIFDESVYEGAEVLEGTEVENEVESGAMGLPKLPKIVRAPELAGLGQWFNSDPLTLEGLRGKVVLVDFWTYSCINCIRTLPYLRGYWEKFGVGDRELGVGDSPFVLLGVHTPEFVFEKNADNVAAAIKKHNLTYPIVQDNDFQTWRAFSNRYWPAKYLIDADGYIRYTHFGEGAYEETDLAIQSLLAEIGEDVEMANGAMANDQDKRYRERSHEVYLGERSWPALQNRKLMPSSDVESYDVPEEIDLHKYALVGDWQMEDGERQVLRSETGEIRMRFVGSEINLVMGPPPDGSGTVNVEIDGESHTSFTVDFEDLYELWTGEYGEHEIVIRVSGEGTSGYAFTFGS